MIRSLFDRRRRAIGAIALVLVPLAILGIFAGAIARADDGNVHIPAAIVNNDELVYQTAADGTQTPVVAGRLLVTQLTATGEDADTANSAASAFDWTITNSDKAADALASGKVYAVLTIPKGFSASIVSLSSDTPVQAQLSIKTDDTHGYVVGPITEAIGGGLSALFGEQISQQFISGLYSGFDSVGDSLTQAADGASSLGDGATSLQTGLTTLAGGATSAQQGAASLASGLTQYTGGVNSLSTGLNTLANSSGGLASLPQGVRSYTSGVTSSAAGLTQVLADPTLSPETRAALEAISGGLNQLSASGGALVAGADGAAAVQSAVVSSAAGATQLAAGSSALVSGANSLSSGLGDLATGASGAAAGAGSLAGGADQLATGLQTGADSVPSYTDSQVKNIAEVGSSPIGISSTRENEVSSVGKILSALIVPLGLWIGALGIVLTLGGPARRLMLSTASTSRLVSRTFLRSALIAALQAVVLVVVAHITLGIAWSLFPATLAFSLVLALSFTALHQLFSTLFGRAGAIISLVLLAIQLVSTGGLYPIELIAKPFQVISPFLPMTHAVNGFQTIITGAGIGGVIVSAVVLIAFGAGSFLLTLLVTTRRRTAKALGLVAAPA